MGEREDRVQRLKRLKRKRMITMVALCVILAGLCGGYFLINRQNAKKADEEAKKQQTEQATEETEVTITTFLQTDVAEIAFTNEEDSYHFVWTEVDGWGNWIRQGEEDFPTNLSKVQTIIACFSEMTGTMRIEAEKVNLATYGLEDTTFSAKLTLRDGSVHQFYLGDEAPYSSGYYMLYENTGDVFVVADNVYTQLNTKKIKLVEGETFPSAQPESMMELRIEVRDGETTSYVPTEEEDGSFTYPPIFYDSVRFVASTIHEYNCKDFSKYGLDDPYVTVTIDYLGYEYQEDGSITREPMTMVLEIGDKTVSDNYYVRVNGSDFVYIMMEAMAQKYLPK